MPDADDTIKFALEWNGNQDAAEKWAEEHAEAIEQEASSGKPGVIAATFDSLVEMAESDDEAAAWNIFGFFGSAKEAASTGLHKVTRLFSLASRNMPDLLEKMAGLFQRYRAKLKTLAKKLGAEGYSVGVTIPWGFQLTLNF